MTSYLLTTATDSHLTGVKMCLRAMRKATCVTRRRYGLKGVPVADETPCAGKKGMNVGRVRRLMRYHLL